MSQQLSKLWLLGPPFAIAVSALTYYAMFPSFRNWVDARVPWVATHVGVHLPARDDDELVRRMQAAGKAQPNSATPELQEPVDATRPPITAPPKPNYLTTEGTVDLPKLAANSADWPKTVALVKAREFPAVVEGKVVGNALVPKGTEVRLVRIKAGKLGLEYRGGGTWAEVGETDLAERVPRGEQ